MPRNLTQLSIFVSGTSETDSEKSAAKRVVEELTKQLEKTYQITLRVLLWPDDVRPGVNTGPQAEINRQIGSRYDIYVGLLGAQFGSPTPRAGSGTEEEFQVALARFKEDSRGVRLLFYFKRATEDPFLIDPDQLKKVLSFRESLSLWGILYKDFRDTSDFVQQLKDHLYNLIVDEWRESSWTPIEISPERTAAMDSPASVISNFNDSLSDHPPNDDSGSPELDICQPMISEAKSADLELGILDYAEGFHQAAASLEETIGRLSADTTKFNDQFQQRALEVQVVQQELDRLRNIGGSRAYQESVTRAKKVVDDAAGDLMEYVGAITSNVERYRSDNRAMFTNLLLLVDSRVSIESYIQSSNEDRTALQQLIQVLETSRQNITGFQATILRIPPLTGKFNRARSQTASILGELIAEISLSIDETRSVLNRIESQ